MEPFSWVSISLAFGFFAAYAAEVFVPARRKKREENGSQPTATPAFATKPVSVSSSRNVWG